MGTRADFYIKNNKELEWMGSIAWDGYEIDNVAKAVTEKEYRYLLEIFLGNRDDSTYPKDGWPWPWNNSKLTDECYIFIPGKPFGIGKVWRVFENDGPIDFKDHTIPLTFCPIDNFPGYNEEIDAYEKPSISKAICVPDMTELKRTTLGPRAGLIVVGG